MVAIFENRKIEKNELNKDKLKFPKGSSTNLGPYDSNLKVKVEQNEDTSLAIENIEGQTYLTGWKEFAKKKGIKKGDAISLYKEDGNFGSEPRYWIEVKKRDG